MRSARLIIADVSKRENRCGGATFRQVIMYLGLVVRLFFLQETSSFFAFE